MNISTKEIYKKPWFFNFMKPSLFDTTPLRTLIQNKTDLAKIRANKNKQFMVSCTDFSSGNSVVYDINEVPDSFVVNILLASASPPVFFPPVEVAGRQLVDAGVTDNFGLTRAINAGCTTLYVIKYPPSRLNPVKNKIGALANTIIASMEANYAKEKASIVKINQIASRCGRFDPTIRPIKIIEIVTSNPSLLHYDFLDFDFKGRDREALWQDGYDTALKALNEHKSN